MSTCRTAVRPCPWSSGFTIPMRGNEIDGMWDFLAAIEFTIPMRGNENAPSLLRTATASRFTIPMGGNEDKHLPNWRVRRYVFTIPMRGNETIIWRDGTMTTFQKFTIPMRGNERGSP